MLLHEIGDVTTRAAKVTPAAVKNVETLVKSAAEYGSIKWDLMGWGFDMNPFVEMLKAATKVNGAAGGKAGGATGGAAGGAGSTTVILELDGKELGRTVEALLGKRNKLRSVIA
jgi:hypothetical protein